MNNLIKTIYPYYFKFFVLRRNAALQARYVRELKGKGSVKLSFIVSALSMWRLQSLYDLLAKDSRFDISILLYPFASYSKAEQEKSISGLKDFFCSRGIVFYDLTSTPTPGKYIRETINPDIIFYPQPYHQLYNNDLDSDFFEDKLICYVHYSLNIFDEAWVYNQRLTNLAWRVFHASQADLFCAKKYTYNKGKNVRIVGCPLADQFIENPRTDPWKPQSSKKKRIIWAPHYSIANNGILQRSHFLSLSGPMLNLASTYKDTIQFVFKPHPRLLTELYKNPDWGETKANEYYAQWRDGENTQLEAGAYIDLFLTSDAMIHDCCSFSAEYLYTHKPVFYTTRDLNAEKTGLHELGRQALDAHYHGLEINDIQRFIEGVVCSGEDTMHDTRERFFQRFLLPPNGQSAAMNIYQDLLSGLRFE